jgi:hypothetical protein
MSSKLMINSSSATVRSCIECRRRKIKCDRSLPCSYCVKVKIQCSYPQPKDQKSDNNPTGEDLINRIAKVEQRLESVDQSLSQIRQLLQTQASSSAGKSYEGEVNRHQQKHGNTEYGISHGYTPCKMLADPTLESLRPPPVLIISLWQKYLDNVDPILKILHAPSTQRQILSIYRSREALSLSIECLMFAIYHAAVMTMTADDCQIEFKENKSEILKRYLFVIDLTIHNLLIPQDTALGLENVSRKP